MPTKIEVSLKKEKETKRTIRYQSESEWGDDAISTLYISKRSLHEVFGEFPDKITVTVEMG